MPNEPFRLVDVEPSQDVIQSLTYLLDMAQQGRLIAFAYSGAFKGKTYGFGVKGEYARNPSFALAHIRLLEHDLANKILNK